MILRGHSAEEAHLLPLYCPYLFENRFIPLDSFLIFIYMRLQWIGRIAETRGGRTAAGAFSAMATYTREASAFLQIPDLHGGIATSLSFV